MSFLKYQNESPEFLNNYLKYKRYIEFCAETSVNETYYDLRTLLRYIKLFLYDKDKLKTITKEEFKGMSIKNITTNDLEKMKPHDLENYIIFLCENLENEVVSRNRKLASLKRFYEYLEHNNYISWNPAKFLENARIAKRLPKYLTLSESKKLLSNTIQSDDKNKFRNYAITCLFLNCGLRVSELIGINLSDLKIDKSEKSVKIRGKGNKERILYLDNAVVEAINTYLKIRPNLGKEYKDHDALFISNQNNRISKRMVQTIIKEELENTLNTKAKEYHTHSLRHTSATLLYNENNTDILVIKEILGHSSLATTEMYTHVSNQKLKEIVEKYSVSSILEKMKLEVKK